MDDQDSKKHRTEELDALNLFEPITTVADEPPPKHVETQLVDHFAEFLSINAFILEAYAHINTVHEPLKPAVIEGGKQLSQRMQSRGQELKVELEYVCKRK